ncbi:hypothetical protein LSH36_1325g00004 [Paralvinella palmiformis]|uniref:Uncharacterized protein n=1 Tax=Paralvinella palmiformis TaxID=53620 RepID=A0AAD9ITX7_9ANNE|nr:hypothetical protein LSH36_1325g00004 [Paralvinella palmiformis]
MQNNLIAKVNNIPIMTKLELLRLDYNPLLEFPDLRNVSSSLRELSIVGASFSRIGALQNLPAIKILKLGGIFLMEFPDLIAVNSSLEELFIIRSRIQSVDYIPLMQKLKKLVLTNNRIKTLPGLNNLSATLLQLDLSHNKIKEVDINPKMAKLQQVNLNMNLLAKFPDLSNAGETLRILKLQNNEITSVPDMLVASLQSLIYLDLRENPLFSLPNLCYMKNTIELFLSEHNLICNWRLAYLKTLETFGTIVYGEKQPHCSQPTYLQHKQWANISVEELLNATGEFETVTNVNQLRFGRIKLTSWNCPFGVRDENYDLSPVRCAALCGDQWNCLMYSASQGGCVLSSHEPGSWKIFNRFTKWYSQN